MHTVSFAQDIAESGGSSAVFGGSFAVVASAGASAQSSSLVEVGINWRF